MTNDRPVYILPFVNYNTYCTLTYHWSFVLYDIASMLLLYQQKYVDDMSAKITFIQLTYAFTHGLSK